MVELGTRWCVVAPTPGPRGVVADLIDVLRSSNLSASNEISGALSTASAAESSVEAVALGENKPASERNISGDERVMSESQLSDD